MIEITIFTLFVQSIVPDIKPVTGNENGYDELCYKTNSTIGSKAAYRTTKRIFRKMGSRKKFEKFHKVDPLRLVSF